MPTPHKPGKPSAEGTDPTTYPNEVDSIRGDVVSLTWSPTAGMQVEIRDQLFGEITSVSIPTDQHGALPRSVADRTLGQLVGGLRAETMLMPDGDGGKRPTYFEVDDPDAVEVHPHDLLMPGMCGDLDSVEWLHRSRALDDDPSAEPLPHPTWNRYIILNEQDEAVQRPGPLIDVGAAVERLTRSQATSDTPFTLRVRAYRRSEADDADVSDSSYIEEALGEEVVRVEHQPPRAGYTRVQVYDAAGQIVTDQHVAHDPRELATTLLVNRAMRAAGYE